MDRISRDDYYMEMAKVAAQRADCLGTKVGAVVIVEDRIVSTGYNGAPDGVTNCSDGGCPRCAARGGGEIKSGADLDKCLCVHAEENAILSSARHGIALRGCVIYTTVQPCLGCLRQIIQVQAQKVLFVDSFSMDALTKKAYERLCDESRIVVEQLKTDAPPKTVTSEDTLENYQASDD